MSPYYSVTVEGQDITSWVSSVQVVEHDREADSVTLTVADPRMIYADAVLEGCRAEIDLGYDQPGQHTVMLRALITRVEQEYPQDGVPTCRVSGEDKSIEMGLVERKKIWRDTTVRGIVREIGRSYGFAAVEVDVESDGRIAFEHQDGTTDLAFLQELAGKYHAKCFVELDRDHREVLWFMPDRRILNREPRPDMLVLRYRQGPGSNLMTFSPSFDASFFDRVRDVTDFDTEDGGPARTPDHRKQPQPAAAYRWDLPADGPTRASSADWRRIQALHDAGMRNKVALQRKLAAPKPVPGAVARTRGELADRSDVLETRREGMSATGTTVGTIWLRAKSAVVIAGVHRRFDRRWYVTSVTHTIDQNGYRTDFKVVC